MGKNLWCTFACRRIHENMTTAPPNVRMHHCTFCPKERKTERERKTSYGSFSMLISSWSTAVNLSLLVMTQIEVQVTGLTCRLKEDGRAFSVMHSVWCVQCHRWCIHSDTFILHYDECAVWCTQFALGVWYIHCTLFFRDGFVKEHWLQKKERALT